jgi:carboxymethylenebutenolidase
MFHRRGLVGRLLGGATVALAAFGGWFRNDARAQGGPKMTPKAMIELFEKHVNAELAGDLATTMATMGDNPHLNHVPTRAGGVGRAGVEAFYRNHLVGKFFPPDVKMEPISRTVGETSVVDEIFISFTHTTAIDWLLPGVAPTSRPVEMVVAVVVGFKDGRISHEHIYWDQASVLVQVGLLDPKGLPVGGADVARKVRDPSLPPRKM